MTDVTLKHIDDVAAYDGEHKIPGIAFRSVRAELGVTAWGMNILDLEPGCEGHPVHDHQADGQEEVYIVLSGAAELLIDGKAWPLSTGSMVRVPPDKTRQLVTKERGARVLALGATPGKAFEPTM